MDSQFRRNSDARFIAAHRNGRKASPAATHWRFTHAPRPTESLADAPARGATRGEHRLRVAAGRGVPSVRSGSAVSTENQRTCRVFQAERGRKAGTRPEAFTKSDELAAGGIG